MAATNAPLALGGMTQHCWRWGWRMFFLVPAQSSSRWRDRQFAVPRPFSPTAARSSARVPWEVWNRPAQSDWLLSRRQKSGQPPVSPVACGSTQPRSLLPPVAEARSLHSGNLEDAAQPVDDEGAESFAFDAF